MRKRTFLSPFLIATICFSLFLSFTMAGCSDNEKTSSNNKDKVTLYSLGDIPDSIRTPMRLGGIDCAKLDIDNISADRPIVLAPKILKKIALDPELRDKLKEFFIKKGQFIVLSPKDDELSTLHNIIEPCGIDQSQDEKIAKSDFAAFSVEDKAARIFLHRESPEKTVTSRTEDYEKCNYVYTEDGQIILAVEGESGTTETPISQSDVKITDSEISVNDVICQSALLGDQLSYLEDGKVITKTIDKSSVEEKIKENYQFVLGFKALAKWIKNRKLAQENLDEIKSKVAQSDTFSTSETPAINIMKDAWGTEVTNCFEVFTENKNGCASKNMIVTNYIVSVHHFDGTETPTGGRDYYFIVQNCSLDGSGGYSKKWAGTRYETAFYPDDATDKEKDKGYYVGQGEVIDNYISQYEIKNYLDRETGTNINVAGQASPQADNESTTIESSIGWNVGVDITGGYANESPQGLAKLAFGYSATDTTTFTKSDIEIRLNTATSKTGDLTWVHQVTKLAARNSKKWQRLDDPATLAFSTYTPTHMWIWCVPTSEAANYTDFKTSLNITRCSTLTKNSGSIKPRNIFENTTVSFETPIPKPPLLAVDNQELIFSKNASTKIVRIQSQYPWNYTINPNSAWLQILRVEKKPEIHVTVSNNNGSVPRTGKITIMDNNKTTSGTIDITQYNTDTGI